MALEREQTRNVHDEGFDRPEVVRETLQLASRQISAYTQVDRLYTWAVLEDPGHEWAQERLQGLDPKKAGDVLEWRMRHSEPDAAEQAFADLRNVDPARASNLARESPADQQNEWTIPMYQQLRQSGPVPDETRRITAIIGLLRQGKNVSSAIFILVPKLDPLHHPDRAIDEALVQLLERPSSQSQIDWELQDVTRALARRGRMEYFERTAQRVEECKDPILNSDLLLSLVNFGQHDLPAARPKLLRIIEPQLHRTNFNVPKLLWATWAADLRELQPTLLRLATRTAEEPEDARASQSGGRPFLVNGHFHLARWIATLWGEEDVFTRTRLLLAFTAAHPLTLLDDEQPALRARLRQELQRAAQALSADERKAVAALLDQWKSTPPLVGDLTPEDLQRAILFAHEALGF